MLRATDRPPRFLRTRDVADAIARGRQSESPRRKGVLYNKALVALREVYPRSLSLPELSREVYGHGSGGGAGGRAADGRGAVVRQADGGTGVKGGER